MVRDTGSKNAGGDRGGRHATSSSSSSSLQPTTGTATGTSHNRINEKIIAHLRELYTQPQTGLIDIGRKVGRQLLPPREKITVLLIGNHSAGKSTFINWYIEETLQKTGVAMETSQITLVTSGRRREQLGGEATVEAFPFIKDIVEEAGLKSSIVTEVSASRQKAFPLITFVDTPGLVDGEMQYAFDIKRALLNLGQMADLIVVFFDPIGQALSKRSLDIVEALQAQCGDNHHKIRYYLSKADTAGTDQDRQKVITQIIQNMCRRPALNQVAFELPTIYIPNDSDPLENSRVPNQIEELEMRIKETINHVVQNSLNQFKSDSETVLNSIDETITEQEKKRAKQLQFVLMGAVLMAVGVLLIAAGALALVAMLAGDTPTWHEIDLHASPWFWTITFASYNAVTLFMRLAGDSLVGQYAAPWTYVTLTAASFLAGHALAFKRGNVLTKAQLQALRTDRQTVKMSLENNFKTLYSTYLGEAVGNTRSL
ncbi:hypothetical protein PTSG_00356 [Salpingoeca rosetta]|uniref:G domain-containing protein n=1 Tax=Salpingoeca rosetta (strain ATCC 50818 / BSB-021) TaxID=946362 RepID=F2TW89_SALR5|nr:uncharacterized protein PTSG_00356 [Salpingoeca rosetta]EGD72335.1 hypothetical protein PTSG_00356 [Salpingoeca rosetta]|eukprot:XP_004998905.1 hypothetical protein PTSG_00356 [Salpingoeca rosetta]